MHFYIRTSFVYWEIDLLEKVLQKAKDSTTDTESGKTDASSRRKRKQSRKKEPSAPKFTNQQLKQVERVKR